MGNDLEEEFEELTKKVPEFSDLKQYRIKIEKNCFGGKMISVKTRLKNPSDTKFDAGVSAGYIFALLPLLILFSIKIAITSLKILNPSHAIFRFSVIFLFLFVILILFVLFVISLLISLLCSVIQRHEPPLKYKDFDFVIFADERSLAHEVAHIHLHREVFETFNYKGFRNGLKFFFNANVKGDIEVEEFLHKRSVQTAGKLHGLLFDFLNKYMDKIGGIYRFFRII